MMANHSYSVRAGWLAPFLVPSCLLFFLTACTPGGTQLAFERSKLGVDAYLATLSNTPADTTAIDEGLSRFNRVYADLTHPDIGAFVDTAYAPTLYFNDTLHTFTERDGLREYLMQTGKNINQSSVDIQQVLIQDTDVFVRWTMYFQVGEGDQAIRSHSIGISHLRFNSEGQVVLHQDYWDSAGALYTHLPVVGGILRAAQKQVGQPK
jgi:hypothetical protein